MMVMADFIFLNTRDMFSPIKAPIWTPLGLSPGFSDTDVRYERGSGPIYFLQEVQ